MASNKEYLDYVLELLRDLDDVTYRYMMSEYILYYKDKIFGGIYDNRFLVKPTKSVLEKVQEPHYEIPYPTGKEMILIDNEDSDFLKELIEDMYEELPNRKRRKR